jgi:hypothetical protein
LPAASPLRAAGSHDQADLFMAFHDKAIKDEIQAMSPWEIHENVNKVIVRSAIDIVWDTDRRRQKFVQENMSADAADDRNFFGVTVR